MSLYAHCLPESKMLPPEPLNSLPHPHKAGGPSSGVRTQWPVLFWFYLHLYLASSRFTKASDHSVFLLTLILTTVPLLLPQVARFILSVVDYSSLDRTLYPYLISSHGYMFPCRGSINDDKNESWASISSGYVFYPPRYTKEKNHLPYGTVDTLEYITDLGFPQFLLCVGDTQTGQGW